MVLYLFSDLFAGGRIQLNEIEDAAYVADRGEGFGSVDDALEFLW